MKDVPEVLNKITDVVLAYRPKPRTKAARKRKKKAMAAKQPAKRAAD
jgi:hypothetical protein